MFLIEINEAKTFKSKDLFEFAKRFFYKGTEISPFPLGAVLQSRGDVALMSVAMDNAFAKSWFQSWVLNGNPVFLFSKFFETFGVHKDKSYGPSNDLWRTLQVMSVARWVENGGDIPFGLKHFHLRCTTSIRQAQQKLGYAFKEVATNMITKLIAENYTNTQRVKEQFWAMEREYASHPDYSSDDEYGMVHPLLDVLMQKDKDMKEVWTAQYSFDKTVQEHRTDWSKHVEKLSQVFPSLDTINNVKGSALRARIHQESSKILRKFIKENWGGDV